MLDWNVFNRYDPPESGQYIVFCTAPQWDSEWVDIAIFSDGVWGGFRSPISHNLRVRQYAKINFPNGEFQAPTAPAPQGSAQMGCETMDTDKLKAHVWQKEKDGKLTVGLGSAIAYTCNLYEGKRDSSVATMTAMCLERAHLVLDLPDAATLRGWQVGENGEPSFVDINVSAAKEELAQLATSNVNRRV